MSAISRLIGRSRGKEFVDTRSLHVRSRFLVAAGLVVMSSAAGWAQTQKIAVIDMQAALLGTKDGQKAAADLKAKFTPREQDLQKRQSELQSKQDEFRKTENTISDDAKARLTRDIESLTKSIQRDSQDAQQDLEQDQQKILGELGQKMMQVLQKYSTEKQITVVLDVSGQPNNVLFASNTIDITRDIISLYDQTALTAPAAPAARPAAPASSAPTTSAPRPSTNSTPAPAGSPAASAPAAARRPAPAATTPAPGR